MQPSLVTQDTELIIKNCIHFYFPIYSNYSSEAWKQNSSPVYHNKKKIYNYKTLSFENEKPLRLTAKKYSRPFDTYAAKQGK